MQVKIFTTFEVVPSTGKLVTSQKQLHETVHSKFEEQLSEAAASSPLLYLLCSQLPWVCAPPNFIDKLLV